MPLRSEGFEPVSCWQSGRPPRRELLGLIFPKMARFAVALGERPSLTNDPDGDPNIHHRRTKSLEQE
jgi:hypothetical protein